MFACSLKAVNELAAAVLLQYTISNNSMIVHESVHNPQEEVLPLSSLVCFPQ